METDIYQRLIASGMDDIVAYITLLEARQNKLKSEIESREYKIEQLRKTLQKLTSVDRDSQAALLGSAVPATSS